MAIGVAGGSGSGKSTFTVLLTENLHDASIQVIKYDSYYRPLDHLTVEERARVNFDHPDALDTEQLIADILKLKSGHAVHVPEYDFNLHTRKKEARYLEPPTVLIVEGILTLADARLRDVFDMKIFIDTDPDDRLIRRIKRDIQERGRSVNNVIHQYLETVKPMHLEFVEPSKRWADVIVPRGGKNQVCLDLISRKIHALVNREYPEKLHAIHR